MKFTNRTVRLGDSGLVQSISKGAHSFLYRVSTTKDPGWNVGDEVEIGGGRTCVYAKSTGAAALFCAHGCEFSHAGLTAIAAFGKSYAVGADTIEAPAATHAALVQDELAGGMVIIFDGVSDYYTTTRMITGNAPSAANAAITLYLDAEITYAITAGTSKCEVYRSPYSAIQVASDAALPKAGLPMAYVSTAENYFWLLKEGICWAAPQATVENNEGVGVYWRHDGSLEGAATALGGTIPDADTTQSAGYRIAGSAAGNGPLVMLKC